MLALKSTASEHQLTDSASNPAGVSEGQLFTVSSELDISSCPITFYGQTYRNLYVSTIKALFLSFQAFPWCSLGSSLLCFFNRWTLLETNLSPASAVSTSLKSEETVSSGRRSGMGAPSIWSIHTSLSLKNMSATCPLSRGVCTA